MRLSPQHQAGPQGNSGQKRRLAPQIKPRRGMGKTHRQQRPQQTDQTIRPDLIRLPRHSRRRRLHPVNPNRLFVAWRLTKTDIDPIARGQHLPRGLREKYFVAVKGRQAKKPRQRQSQHHKQRQAQAPPFSHLMRNPVHAAPKPFILEQIHDGWSEGCHPPSQSRRAP